MSAAVTGSSYVNNKVFKKLSIPTSITKHSEFFNQLFVNVSYYHISGGNVLVYGRSLTEKVAVRRNKLSQVFSLSGQLIFGNRLGACTVDHCCVALSRPTDTLLGLARWLLLGLALSLCENVTTGSSIESTAQL
jgi:hypothetical protein